MELVYFNNSSIFNVLIFLYYTPSIILVLYNYYQLLIILIYIINYKINNMIKVAKFINGVNSLTT